MFSITTNRVRDAVKVTEGTESMILRVDFDPMAFVRVLETAKAKLAAVRYAQDDSAPQVVQAARDFARRDLRRGAGRAAAGLLRRARSARDLFAGMPAPQVNVEVGLNGENLVEYVSTQQQLGLQSYNMSKWQPK